MSAYYNEHDPNAAAWLRELIKAGHIAPGEVDERSIIEVEPSDVRGFKQCHFFAGIGGWSYALRLAGWPDDRPVWTGSPPCQPFSAAGKQQGAKDERHLWPAFFAIIRECRPAVLFGEQVAAAIRQHWIDAVFADLESQEYACGLVVLPACSVGAPHLRQRLWFVADGAQRGRRQKRANRGRQRARDEAHGRPSARLKPSRDAGELADANGGQSRNEELQRGREHRFESDDSGADGRRVVGSGSQCVVESKSEQHNRNGNEGRRRRELADGGGMGDTGASGLSARERETVARARRRQEGRATEQSNRPWTDPEWLQCADGKARPTKPGLFPLAHGVPRRTMALRGAGNAIVPQVAAQVIGAYMDAYQD